VSGYTAHLRVYQPLGAFSDAERQHWSSYVESGSAQSRPLLMAREHEMAVAATLARPQRLDVGAGEELAYVRHLDGLTYVCPWRLQVRTWAALAEFRAMLPDEVSDAFVPAPAADDAEREYDSWVSTHPDDTVGILTSTWQVPIPWFVLFEAEERRLVLGERRPAGAIPPSGPNSPAGTAQTGLDRALVYLTAMSRARRRSARAISVVRRAFGDGPALEALEELGRWLEDFHPHSLVELDYGGLVHLMDDETLAADTSVADLAESLGCLANGDPERAGEIYDAVVGRWRHLAALEHAN
jgi:hypothetical protein